MTAWWLERWSTPFQLGWRSVSDAQTLFSPLVPPNSHQLRIVRYAAVGDVKSLITGFRAQLTSV